MPSSEAQALMEANADWMQAKGMWEGGALEMARNQVFPLVKSLLHQKQKSTVEECLKYGLLWYNTKFQNSFIWEKASNCYFLIW